jgi:tRNA-specific 2-thiouridylase
MKILVAMSGGVDSSVAAALLVDRGHEVVGVHMALNKSSDSDIKEKTRKSGCCNLDDITDARRSAAKLGIPFYVWDLSEEFHKNVIQNFITGYKTGSTPNPCIECNRTIKFKLLLQKAKAIGFDKVATGHYARILHDGGRYELHRAVDLKKDQSYVLSDLTEKELQEVLFPLGELESKSYVREIASSYDMQHISKKRDSFGVCFLGGKSVENFIRKRVPLKDGEVVHASTGSIIGRHDGVQVYTVGQRRGFVLDKRIGSHSRPLYIKEIDTAKNRLVVDYRENLLEREMKLISTKWVDNEPPLGQKYELQLSAHGEANDAKLLSIKQGTTHFQFNKEIFKVANGQRATIYSSSKVIGGGTVALSRDK